MKTFIMYRQKAILSLCIILLSALGSWAQDGSTCDKSIPLTATGTFSFKAEAWTIHYYSFTPSSDCTLEIARTNNAMPVVSVYSSCSSSNDIGELASLTTYKASIKANTKYYIQWTSLKVDTIEWTLQTKTNTPGEFCDNPIVITQNTEFTVKNPSILSKTYYKYVATQDVTVHLQQTDINATFSVKDACDGETVSTESDGNYSYKFQATKDKSYFIELSSYVTVDYTWKFSTSTGTPGEFCTSPIEITNLSNIAFANTATLPTQYFSYTAPKDGILEVIDTLSASVSIYDDCNGSSIETTKGNRNTVIASKDKTYIIKWNNYSTKDFTWNLTLRDTILGEYCEKPIVVSTEGTINFPQSLRYDTRYYSYTPAKDGLLVLSDGDLYGEVTVFDGCNGTELGSDSNGELKLNIKANKKYIISWKTYTDKSFSWTLGNRQPIDGELCSKPIQIKADGDITFSLANKLKTQYYTYTPTMDGIISITDNDLYNDVYVYDACNGTELAYSYNGDLKLNVVASKTYYIKMVAWGDADFVWSIKNRVPLPGEMCNKPIVAKLGSNTYEYNSLLTERFYTFTASKTGIMEITDARRTNYLTVLSACEGSTIDYNWAGELQIPIVAGKQYIIRWQNSTTETFNWDITERDSIVGEFCNKPIIVTAEGEQLFSDANELQEQYYKFTVARTGLLAVWDTKHNDVAIYSGCNTSQLNTVNCSDTLKIPVKKGESYIIKWRNNASLGFKWFLINRIVRPGELTPIFDSVSVVVNETYAPVSASFKVKTNAESVEWNFDDNSDNTTERNPVHQYSNAGTYYPSVLLSKGCFSKRVYVKSFTLKAQPSSNCTNVNISATITNNKCNGDTTGAIRLTVTKGKQPYYFIWSTTRHDSELRNLENGSYAVTVIDADSNRCVKQFDVKAQSDLSVNATVLNNTCNKSDGSISLTVSGGSEPYNYLWSNNETSSSITALSPNYYSVRVSDANKCSAFGSYRISTQNMPLIDTVLTKSVSCDSTDGVVIVAVKGVAGGPYRFEWNDGDRNFARRSLAVGTYTAYLTDTVSKCSTSVEIKLARKAPLTQNIAMVSVSQETGKNVIVWERVQRSREIDAYIILRENKQGNYTLAGRVPSSMKSVYTDAAANPKTQAWRYRIVAADKCGQISKPGAAHRTMRIQQQAAGSGVLVKWDAYEGFDVKNFMVCRKNADKTIDTLARKSYMATEFIDFYPRKGSQYFIAVNLMRTIDTSMLKTDTGPFSQSFSNMSEASLVENDDNNADEMVVYPNPASELLHVKLSTSGDKLARLQLIASDGKVVFAKQLSDASELDVDLSQLTPGLYQILLEGNNTLARKTVVKK